ncbi:MAG: hypothetical protein EA389_09985 [Ilumatobacter sp.]|nr:MAG: hypothetical protein EA389_09985 [Ilumatobacter sp.]
MATPRTRSSRRAPDRVGRDDLFPAAVTVMLAGAALGLGSWVAIGRPTVEWSSLWAAGIVWAFGALIVGTVMPTPLVAAAGGAVSGLLAAATHHLGSDWFDGMTVDGAVMQRSMVAAVLVGPVLGASGYWLRYRVVRSRPLTIGAGAGAALVIALIVIEALADQQ